MKLKSTLQIPFLPSPTRIPDDGRIPQTSTTHHGEGARETEAILSESEGRFLEIDEQRQES